MARRGYSRLPLWLKDEKNRRRDHTAARNRRYNMPGAQLDPPALA